MKPQKLVIREPFYSHEEATLTLKVIVQEMEAGATSGSDPAWALIDDAPQPPQFIEYKHDVPAMTAPGPAKKAAPIEADLTDDSLMIFGAHKGKALKDVPNEYLLWWYQANEEKGNNNSLTGFYLQLWKYIVDNADSIIF